MPLPVVRPLSVKSIAVPVVNPLCVIVAYPAPVYTPDPTRLNATPVVSAVSVSLNTVPAVDPVEPISTMVPFVAPPVSIELEERRRSEPVSAITEVA